MEGWRRWLRLTVVLASLVAFYFLMPATAHPDRSDVVRLAICVVVVALLALIVVWQVRLQMVDSQRRVDGLVIALVVAVLTFAAAFYITDELDPEQIVGLETRLDALYFTVTTLMTVGFGDVHAEGQAARGIVLVQMIFNVAVIATAATTLSRRVRERAIAHAQSRIAAGDLDRPRLRRRPGRQGRDTHRNPT